jgi:glycosyltransferase involved in cell wall biosynthesis
VAIGRNEGTRLEKCLKAALKQAAHVVYVDSGSDDGSPVLAEQLGVKVVALDMSIPFTAARARNEGVARLKRELPDVDYVQFVDGDCELHPTWIETALDVFAKHPGTAVVCGRRRERSPEVSLYNHLVDIEWATPVGEAAACGGDSLILLKAFDQVDGFSPALIAGEEPDLCFRMRLHGWKVLRIDAEMTLHDAAITRFSQWWKRNQRSGHASAEAFQRRGSFRDKQQLKEVLSNVAWSLPVAWPLWPVLWWKVFSRRPDPTYATFIVLGKLPHCHGQVQFWTDRLLGKTAKIIEYKGAAEKPSMPRSVRPKAENEQNAGEATVTSALAS